MPLDGLRAWIGEVERKLGKRTRVFLVLSVIAIGGAGAAIYLAIDAQDNSVSEGDVQALQRELEARIGGGAELAQVEAEVSALKAEVEKLQGSGGGSGKGGGASSGGGSGGGSGSGSSGSGSGASSGSNSSGSGSGASTGTVPPANGGGSAKLRELIEKAKEKAEKAEGK
jgi:cell division protein FtsB